MRARLWFATTALVVLVAIVVQAALSARATDTPWETPASRVAALFCYFTIQSNLLVGVTSALLAAGRWTQGVVFDALRLAGVVGITVTFVVYHVALADLRELTGAAHLVDVLLHTVVPLLAVLGWLVFGPRGRVDGRVVAWSLLFPVAWLAFTLVRGALVDFYPYPFLEVDRLGYARVAVNVAIVAVVFVGLALLAWAVDRRLSRRTPGPEPLLEAEADLA